MVQDGVQCARQTVSKTTATGERPEGISRHRRGSWEFVLYGQGEGISGWKSLRGTRLGIRGEGILAELSLSGQGRQAKGEAWLRRGLRGASVKCGQGEKTYWRSGEVSSWRREARAFGRPLFSLSCFFSHRKHMLRCAKGKFCVCAAASPGSLLPSLSQGLRLESTQ